MQAQMLINGVWVEAKTTFTVTDPSTGQEFGKASQATQADVDAAVIAAKQALPEWSSLDVSSRADLVGKVAQLLVERYGNQGELTPLKALIMAEMGKRLPEADIEVLESSDMVAFFAKEAPRLLAPSTPTLNKELWPTKESQVILEPVGVIGIIKPWNYPLELPLWAIAPALIAGNTVVFKPSEHSSFVGIEIGRLFVEAGLPAGVLNIVTGDGSVGEILVQNPDVNMISFTGSVQVGRAIAVECGKQLKKCCLELGGNDPAIVDSEADLDLAANGLVWGAFCNAGQVCVRIKRAFLHQAIADELIDRVVKLATELRPAIDYGPIVSEEQLKQIEAQVSDAVSKGAIVLVGGKRIEGLDGYFFPPTVLTNVTSAMKLMVEECFGPVLPIVKVADIGEAVSFANDSKYGLGASVWTSNVEKGKEISSLLQAGMVWVNDVNVAFPEAPWGGRKQSGFGVELSDWGLWEYVRPKHINVETSEETRRTWWYPY